MNNPIYAIDSEQSFQDLLEEVKVNPPIKITNQHIYFKDMTVEIMGEFANKIERSILRLRFKIQKKDYQIIHHQLQLNSLLDHLDTCEEIAYDTETTGLNVRKDRIIGFSVCGQAGISHYIPLFVWNSSTQKLDPVPGTSSFVSPIMNILMRKKLIMHNASFDIRVTKNSLGFDLIQALHCDTVLAKHTLEEDGIFGLKETAIQYQYELGLDDQDKANQEQIELKNNVILNGGKWKKGNKEMYKADLSVMGYYCNADVDITFRLYHLLKTKLHDQSLHNFFYNTEVMPLCKYVTIPMEDKGLFLDIPLLKSSKISIELALIKLEKEIVDLISQTPTGQSFISDLLNTNYTVKRTGNYAQAICAYYKIHLPRLKSGKFSINEKSLNSVVNLGNHSSNGLDYLLGTLVELPEDEILNIQKILMRKDTGSDSLFNISSKQQLGKLVFEYMGIKPLSVTDKGNAQINDTMIDSLITDHKIAWAFSLREYNKLSKIQSSYIDRFLDGQEEGKFYPTFKQFGTTSGRYSSDLQQLPRPKDEDSGLSPLMLEYINKVREFIISGPNYMFIDDDYESLEPRCFSDDASDEALIEIFTKNRDMYSVVAIMSENITDASADKDADNFLKKIYPNKRQAAKSYALGIRYGLKAYKLSKTLNITEEEAETIIKNYFKAFPKLKAKMDEYIKTAKKTGIIKSKLGRVRHLPRLKEIYSTYGDDVLDFRKLRQVSKKTRTSVEDLKRIRKEYNNLLNNALNFPIQALASSIVNQAAVAMSKKFIDQKLDAWISLNIHDQLVVSCGLKDIEVCKVIVQDCMENTNTLSMPLIAKPEVCYNLKDGH